MSSSIAIASSLGNNSKTSSKEQNKALSPAGRRREQNRLAQRNHRARAREKERQEQQQDGARDSRSPSRESKSPTRGPQRAQPTNTIVVDACIPDSSGSPGSWSGPHSDMQVDSMDQDLSDFVVPCQCSSIFGPCEFHRDAIRSEASMLSLNMMMDQVNADLMLDPLQPILGVDAPFPQPPTPHAQPPQIQPPLPRVDAHAQPMGMTGRFQDILQQVKCSGFKTFDEAVAAYYIHDFEPSSEPDLAQKASRGRRLRSVLNKIEESSAGWTLWEARGYREKVIEAAESIYVGEMERLNTHSKVTPPPDGVMLYNGIDRQNTALTQNLGDPLVSKVYQNESPNLWALLTSLSGHQSANSESAALVALSLLASSHQDPSLKVSSLLGAWAQRMGQIEAQRPVRPRLGSTSTPSRLSSMSTGSSRRDHSS